MVKKLFFIPLIFLSVCSSAQKVLVNVFMEEKVTRTASDTIFHDMARRLSWNDFKGKPDNNHFGGAVTASGYAFDADIKLEGKIIYLNIGVYVFFNKSQSWKKPNINSDYHLLQTIIYKEFGFDLKEHLEVIVIGIVVITTFPVIWKLFFSKTKPTTTNHPE